MSVVSLDRVLVMYSILMIVGNLGAKYIQADIHEGMDEFCGHPITRKLFIFALIYAGIRQFGLSVLIFLVYLIIRRLMAKSNPDQIKPKLAREQMQHRNDPSYDRTKK